MKRKGIPLLIAFFIVLTVSLPGQIDQAGLLPEEICKPLCFLVQDSVFYISDQNQIFFFSNENMQLLQSRRSKVQGRRSKVKGRRLKVGTGFVVGCAGLGSGAHVLGDWYFFQPFMEWEFVIDYEK